MLHTTSTQLLRHPSLPPSRRAVMSDSVRVGVRLRPLNAREQAAAKAAEAGERSVAWSADALGGCINSAAPPPGKNGASDQTASAASKGKTFRYDHVFEPTATNEDLYADLACPVVEGALAGYNGTVFAYGQTSSGKTHSMLGYDADPGITPRAIAHVMRVADEKAGGRKYLVRATYCEIYNEVIRDLLNMDAGEIKIREDQRGHTFMAAEERVIKSSDEAMAVLDEGQRLRSVGETAMNQTSSRSHTIFTLIIESMGTAVGAEKSHRVAFLHLVDLAGSERAKSTQASGARLREGSHINKSLLTLGTIINKLSSASDNSSTQHLPYRDSKLTRVLRDALGGNSKTAVLCAITPSPMHVEETLSTLMFATRAKNVTNKVSRNETVDYKAKYREAIAELNVLRAQVANNGGSGALPGAEGDTGKADGANGDTGPTNDVVALNVELQRTREEIVHLRERMETAELDAGRHEAQAEEKREVVRALRTEVASAQEKLAESSGKHETLQLSIVQAFFRIEEARKSIQLSRKKGSRVMRAEEDLYAVSVKLAMFVPDSEFVARAAAQKELTPRPSSEGKSGGSVSGGSLSDDPGSPPPSPRAAARQAAAAISAGAKAEFWKLKSALEAPATQGPTIANSTSPVSSASTVRTAETAAQATEETSNVAQESNYEARMRRVSSAEVAAEVAEEPASPIPVLEFDLDDAYARGVPTALATNLEGVEGKGLDSEVTSKPALSDEGSASNGYLDTARRVVVKKRSQAQKALMRSFYGGSALQDVFMDGHEVSSPGKT